MSLLILCMMYTIINELPVNVLWKCYGNIKGWLPGQIFINFLSFQKSLYDLANNTLGLYENKVLFCKGWESGPYGLWN